MKPKRWPYRQKKGSSISPLDRQTVSAIGSTIHGASSIELNADGIKISANSITLHQQVMQSENRLMTIDMKNGTIHFQK